MSRKATWIQEIAKEINRSKASLERAIKDTGMEINSKYDVLLCYAKWSVPKLKNVEKQEALYKQKIENLEQLIYDLQKVTGEMKFKYEEQQQRKDELIQTQNEIIVEQERTIAEKDRIIAEMEELLRGLPRASGE